mgnify:CR=1 FL=1
MYDRATAVIAGTVIYSNQSFSNFMPFLFIGLILLGFGIYFYRKATKNHDHDGQFGMMALIIGAVIMILFYGVFYTLAFR